jgi:hypothetical protein
MSTVDVSDFVFPTEWPSYASDFVLPAWLDTAFGDVLHHYQFEAQVPLPLRQYWTIGSTAHDCEQIVLAVQQMFLGTADNPLGTTQCNGPRSITFTIEVVRCVPTVSNRGQAPTGEAIEVSSVNPVVDMEILMDVAKYFDRFNSGIVVTVDVIPAGGGFHGALATYTATL